MIIRSVRLLDFRNSALSEADLDARSVWVGGMNAQGKTNLLEAAGLLQAARSFRTSKSSAMIRHGAQAAQVLFKIGHEEFGECEVLMEFSKAGRRITACGAEVRRLGDFIGRFPVLAVCSEDMKLARGAPQERRRFADMLISSLDAEYFEALRRFHSALAQRNALLKSGASDSASFSAFEAQMAESAAVVSEKRREYLEEAAAVATEKYRALSGGRDKAAIRLKPDSPASSAQEYAALLEAQRPRDALLGATSTGPHRDDFMIFISGKNVREFASEGQQRSAALSLKLAEFDMLKSRGRTLPVMLCDDILGELDSARRAAFWECVDPGAQVVASSTSPAPSGLPSRPEWKSVRVENGEYFAR